MTVDHVLSASLPSRIFGYWQSTQFSQRKIAAFIKKFNIPIHEFKEVPYKSFNDFFIRQFKHDSRTFCMESDKMPAFAEARYIAYEKISEDQVFPVKSQHLTPQGILGGVEKAKPFINGPLLIARLCPTDYHRFHYPDSGRVSDFYRITGHYHSVNPFALKRKSDIFSTNERVISILETKNFGRLAYVEVGALCVGKVIQTHSIERPFSRGEEKGYFLFGASTVILLGEPRKWRPDPDLLEQTRLHRETLLRLGEPIAYVV